MAAFTTVLKEYRDSGDLRVWTISGHTALDPYIVTQTRREPAASNANLETTIKVAKGTQDADGNLLASRVVFSATVKYPKQGQSADVTAALAVFRDLVASDEFTDATNTLNYVQ